MEKEEATFLGRTIGTCSGMDGDIDYIAFYDFEPAKDIPLPATYCLSIVKSSGKWEAYDDSGDDVMDSGKVLPVFHNS